MDANLELRISNLEIITSLDLLRAWSTKPEIPKFQIRNSKFEIFYV